ncbi:hypothetical protein SAMN04515679_1797 [Pelosinus fermentans]|nr:hypothetical protein FR7_01711 [Pelosinus fermentans DSM 17108]SDQ86843.1 hypothetical protein SAMN04515679_1797 [Pelosinus fermentans]
MQFLATVDKILLDGDFTTSKMLDLNKAILTLKNDYTKLIREGTVKATESAKKLKGVEFKAYKAEVQRLLSAQEVAAAEQVFILGKITAEFGGGLDAKVIDSVWNKVWPDALNVDDRIKRLSAKVKEFTERTIKQGISEGNSAANISRILREHFVIEGLEGKAAFRLAAHTTNMVYQATQAEISIQATFVMGIRIVRGMFGKISPKCPICYEHGGDSYKEYFKSYFGGRDIDLWVLANMPPYHSNCSCGIEQITEDAITFIQRARTEYALKNA